MGYTAWIKLEHTTPDKQELYRMSEILNLDVDAVFGKTMRFWIWADQNTENGNVKTTTLAQIDRITYCQGFGKAMLEVGWLSIEDGNLVIPNFDRHNSASAKKRATTLRRVEKYRACNDSVTAGALQKRYESVTDSVTLSSSSSMSSSMSSSESLSGKDEGVGEGKVDDVFQDLPEVLATDSLRVEWLRWEKYLKEVHSKPMQPMMRGPAWQKVLERAPPGEESAYAISTIREAMAAGWKNLHPQEERKHNAKQRQQPDGHYSGLQAPTI